MDDSLRQQLNGIAFLVAVIAAASLAAVILAHGASGVLVTVVALVLVLVAATAVAAAS